MNTYTSKELPINCSDPVIPVFSHTFDSLVPPKYPEIRYVIQKDVSFSESQPKPQPKPQTAPGAIAFTAPAVAEASICNNGGIQYWSPPSLW